VNSYGCVRTDTVQVIILSDCKIYVPTGFTPNHDGLNDKFRIFVGCLKTLTRFTIYNRWGQVIFTTKNGSDSWNGTYKGVEQPGGSYIWIAEGEYKSGKKFSEKGTFTLIR
jgi:gliding motility-associated-like protein